MRLRWECHLFVGPAPVGADPRECGAEFETDAEAEDVAEKSASATCPECGGGLTMEYDFPAAIEAEGSP